MSRRLALLVGWTFALVVGLLFARLGMWQLSRATQKERMLADVAQVLQRRTPQPLAVAADMKHAADYAWAAGAGHFLSTEPLLLDNQQHEGRVGVRAFAVFRPDAGAPLLVDLGWLPIAADRVLPHIAIPKGHLDLRGLLAPPPSAGLHVGAPMVRQGAAWLVVRLEPAYISRTFRLTPALAPRVLRLDPTLPIGYTRDLELLANTLPPERHRGYAVQWFGLAITALLVALVLTFRRRRA